MSNKIIDYTLSGLAVANPDASCPATVTGCAVIAGPAATILGAFAQALDFGANGQIKSTLPVASLNVTKFSVRLAFKIDGAITTRQVLVESNALPFSMFLAPGSGSSSFHLIAGVTTSVFGAGKASTEFFTDLHLGTWYVADLVYDTDTLAVFVNGVIYSVHAFPDGTITPGAGDQLVAGTSIGGADQFKGAMAALQLHDDIPIELEAQLDERRSHPQWYLTYKQEEIKTSLSFGEPTGEFYLDLPSESWIQGFPGGILMHHDANGQAFEMHGAILAAYWALPVRAEIGRLVSDEIPGAQSGSRKNLFSHGGIYWSSTTGAVPVLGQIWVDYEGLGEAGALGLPLSAAGMVGSGFEQLFQRARMYLKSGGAKAFEVHGAILAKYLSSGGPVAWGFPVSNENDILSGSTSIGRLSEFEYCTIYWSASSGAFEVHGDIRTKYRSVGGPGGDLGFPTSDENNVPGAAAPARYNTFQKGSIVWFGSMPSTYVCLAFDIHLERVNTKECEGAFRGQNDVYVHVTIEDNGHVIHAERLPASGDSDGNNIYTPAKTFNLGSAGIIPNSPDRSIKFCLDVWDSDWPDDDDHLGLYEYTLNMANAWGFKGNPTGIINSGSFDNINSILWSVKPHVTAAELPESKKWWGVKNRGTKSITWEQYAAAFTDVDTETEWWDITDWLAKAFYSLVIEGIADGGNCFGMSLEAIYSKKDRSILGLPLHRFTDWDPVRNEFNIKHEYQVGAPAIWWFVGEFLSGKTHDPVSVFHATRDAYNSGCDPVLCIAQNYDFSGAPHCILPIAWNDSVSPWEMTLHDPNFPSNGTPTGGALKTLFVDPVNNTFNYNGGNVYSGGEWSGGRMHYMPFDVVNERPRTPIFEAIMLLCSGMILILGSDSETTSLTDENGIDLDAFGADSIARLKAGRALANKFVSVKGFGDHTRDCAKERPKPRPQDPPDKRRPRPHGIFTSEVYMRSERKMFSRNPPPKRHTSDDLPHVTLREYLCQLAPAEIREKFKQQPAVVAANQGRLMLHLLNDKAVRAILTSVVGKIAPIADQFPAISRNYIHTTRGLRSGKLQYALKEGFTQLMLTGETAAGEAHTFHIKDPGTQASSMSIKGYRDKVFTLHAHNKLGAGNDHLRVSIEGIPLTAGGELKINVKPGIGGVEIVSGGQRIKATINFEYRKRDTVLKSRFDVSEQDGIRIVPSTFITRNQLKVSRINTLFGNALSSKMLSAVP